MHLKTVARNDASRPCYQTLVVELLGSACKSGAHKNDNFQLTIPWGSKSIETTRSGPLKSSTYFGHVLCLGIVEGLGLGPQRQTASLFKTADRSLLDTIIRVVSCNQRCTNASGLEWILPTIRGPFLGVQRGNMLCLRQNGDCFWNSPNSQKLENFLNMWSAQA